MTNGTLYEPRYLLATDFDLTLFDTFSPSPNGITTEKAYALAINETFDPRVIEIYKKEGLKNRAPSELVRDLLRQTNSSAAEDATHQTARIAAISEVLVQKKLAHMMEEIGRTGKDGKMWPYPCGDVLSFLETVRLLKTRGVPIDIAVISSGHEAFIKKTFDVWGMQQPDILVTEDDIRNRRFPKEMERRVKPGLLPLALAHYKWLDQQGLILHDIGADGNELATIGAKTRERIAYIGDSVTKDVAMAQRGKVEALHFPTTSWETLADRLISHIYHFDGRPFRDILSVSHDPRELVEAHIQTYGKERR